MRVLIDTHIALWVALDDARLRGHARDLLRDPLVQPVLSVASMWEISIKASLGKLPLPVSAEDFLAREISARGYETLDVRRPHAARVATLPWPASGHRDPFDRLLIAQALVEGLPLLSADARLNDQLPEALRAGLP